MFMTMVSYAMLIGLMMNPSDPLIASFIMSSKSNRLLKRIEKLVFAVTSTSRYTQIEATTENCILNHLLEAMSMSSVLRKWHALRGIMF